MRVIADLHIHSKYARTTSRDTDLVHLAAGARKKGLDVVGTGDFTHPLWLKELKSKLEPLGDSGLYSFHDVTWLLSSEVALVYEEAGKTRKLHLLVYAPDFECADQASALLSKYGNLSSDGRPVLTGMDSAELVESLTNISDSVVVIPAHAWTPWFSVFGSRSGFDSLKDCFKDQTGKIFAIETGLSSDPAMNWRLSELDSLALVSNSDAHSPNPWRLGREANVLDLPRLAYAPIFSAIRSKDPRRFLYTIEVDPAYGKYHYTGHRKCGVCLSPKDAMKLGNLCPVCHKKLTVGVLQRLEEIADRPEGYRPPNAIPFKSLLSLYEVISYSTGVNRLYSKRVTDLQDLLIDAFGSELNVLLNATIEDLSKVAPEVVVKSILSFREDRVSYKPGYDGVYGSPFGGQRA